jgi:Zn-dependent protease
MPAVDLSNLIQTVLIYALPVLFAITVHEAAHGYAARHFGDNTAAMMGRITLNPIKHIDPIGTLLMPLLLYFATSGAFLFGYAKPVPVRFDQLRNPKPWGFFIVMGLVIAGVVGSLWLRPLMDLGYAVIDFALTPLIALLR